MSRFLARAAVFLAGCALAVSVNAAPFDKIITFEQPDGTVVKLHGWGDEFFATFESEDGYTVVFNRATKAYEYAKLSADGSDLLPTGVVVGKASPATAGVAQHLRINTESRKLKAAARRQIWDKATRNSERWSLRKEEMRKADLIAAAAKAGVYSPPATTTTGTKVGLCLLIDFSDAVATVPQAAIVDFCNGDSYTGYGNNGSVKKYFMDVSNNQLVYSNVVTVYVRAPQPKSYYNDTGSDAGQQANLLIEDAIQAMRSMPNYTNSILPLFSNLTVNGFNEVVACNVFYAGGNGGVWAMGLWPHSWSLYMVGAQELSTGGKQVWNYQITNIGASLELGTFCHENGHMLCDYPDIYDYDYDSVGGAGIYCLMDYGGDGGNPVQVCGYLKRASGWVTTTDLTYGSYTAGILSAPNGTNFNHFYRYQKPGVPTEYYLLENRHQSGRDANILSSGIAIWHVDELGDRDNQSTAYNNSHNNYEVTLVQADNKWDFQNYVNYGEASDLYHLGNSAAGYANRFADTTGPSSRWWDGSLTEIDFKNFSAPGPHMTVDLFIGPTTFLNKGGTLASENCTPNNGVIDPEEAVTVKLALQNFTGTSYSNLTATLLTNSGVDTVSAPTNLGIVLTGGPVVTGLFSFVAHGRCGGLITTTIRLTDDTNDLGTLTYNWIMGIATTNVGISLAENFDSVVASALPSNWTTTTYGQQPVWKTSTYQVDTAPNCAYSTANNGVGENALVSPVIIIGSATAQLTFRHRHTLQAPATGTNAYDGGVLEIKINNDEWVDVIAAGGSFVQGGYNRNISDRYGNPLGGRDAWSGNISSYYTTTVNLPPAAAGSVSQLRWRLGTDEIIGTTGWRIDGISLTDAIFACCGGADIALTMTSIPLTGIAGQPVLFHLSVTNSGPSSAPAVVISNPVPAGVAYQSGSASPGTVSLTNGVIVCNIGSLNNGAVAIADLILIPSNPPATIGAITNIAVATTTMTETQPANNGATNAITVYRDSVGDGIPDWWRAENFGGDGSTTNGTNCAACDPDGDGRTNLQEFNADTQPTNSASLLKIVAITNQPPAAYSLFPSSTGRIYTLEYTTDIITGIWTTVSGQAPIYGNGTTNSLPDTNSPAANFYRVRATRP